MKLEKFKSKKEVVSKSEIATKSAWFVRQLFIKEECVGIVYASQTAKPFIYREFNYVY